jgi:hypothetical protein
MSSMEAQEPAGAAPSPEQDEAADGVFGNLPRTRPGTRSARRDSGEARRRRPSAAQTGGEQAGARQEAGPAESAPPEPEPGSGIEDVAWAGVAAAAEAATIGVRLASRAMEAVKDAGKRT